MPVIKEAITHGVTWTDQRKSPKRSDSLQPAPSRDSNRFDLFTAPAEESPGPPPFGYLKSEHETDEGEIYDPEQLTDAVEYDRDLGKPHEV